MNTRKPLSIDGTRRDFLKTTATAVAGLGVAGAIAPAVHASSDETIKIALIGCGNRGAGALVQALSTKGAIQLWAMADTFQDRIDNCLNGVRRELKGEPTGKKGGKGNAKRKMPRSTN